MKKTTLKVVLRDSDPVEVEAYEILSNLFIHKTIMQSGEPAQNRWYTISNNHGFRILDPDIGTRLRDLKKAVIDNLSGLNWDIKDSEDIPENERAKYTNAIGNTHKQLTAIRHNQ